VNLHCFNCGLTDGPWARAIRLCPNCFDRLVYAGAPISFFTPLLGILRYQPDAEAEADVVLQCAMPARTQVQS
jgi:hypothetical protein